MSQAVIEQDWDRVASLAADLHDAHARLVDFVATVLAEGPGRPPDCALRCTG